MCHNTHHIIYIAIDQNHKVYDEPWVMAYYCWRNDHVLLQWQIMTFIFLALFLDLANTNVCLQCVILLIWIYCAIDIMLQNCSNFVVNFICQVENSISFNLLKCLLVYCQDLIQELLEHFRSHSRRKLINHLFVVDCGCVALAIESIKESLNLTSWTGDPCVYTPYDWIKCNNDIIPRVITV